MASEALLSLSSRAYCTARGWTTRAMSVIQDTAAENPGAATTITNYGVSIVSLLFFFPVRLPHSIQQNKYGDA